MGTTAEDWRRFSAFTTDGFGTVTVWVHGTWVPFTCASGAGQIWRGWRMTFHSLPETRAGKEAL